MRKMVQYRDFQKTRLERNSSDLNENQPKHQNRNFLKTFCKHLR